VRMADWRNCKLGDLLQIKHGFAFLGEHFASAGTHVVLTPGNFLEEGGFKEKADKAKWYVGPIPDDYVLNKGDLIVAMTEQAEGLLGSSALIPRSDVYLHNQRLGLVQIRNQKQADRHFIYYLFNSKSVRQQIRGSASGTKIRHTAPSRIADVKVSVPPLPTQQRIAAILSAYDELIENSQRRIKILEAMACGLYREWFVHFRFPGHENHPRVALALGEIPEGWEVKKLGDLVEFKKGKKPTVVFESAANGLQRHLLIDALRGGSSKEFVAPEKLISTTIDDSIMVMDGSGSSGVFIGYEGVIGSTLGRYRVLADVGVGPFWLFLLFSARLEEIKSKNIGSAIPHANKDFINGMDVAVGPKGVMQTFDKTVMPMFGMIRSLRSKVNALRKTRDLLLPRLLSGQINALSLSERFAA
jgi:type I restriction enzyme S subunit